jgi:hypothetical protein
MTTSFSLNAYEAIEEGIALSGGHPTDAEELERAKRALNLIQQIWATKGINLWKVENIQVAIPIDTATVSLGTDVFSVLGVSLRHTPAVGDATDSILAPLAYNDYLALNNKALSGKPTQYLLQRKKAAPEVTVWQVPSTNEYSLNAWVVKKFDDINAYTDSPDIPAKFLPALTMGIGYYLGMSRSNGTAEWEAKLQRMKQEYEVLWQMAYEEDQDKSNFSIVPRVC